MARGEPLIRQWNLLKTLQNFRYGFCADELAERMACSKRQVQRDLSVLQLVGFPIQFEQRDFGKKFWKLSSNFVEQSDLILSVTEMLSLFLSRQLLAPLAGTQFGDGLSSAIDKIKASLPGKALEHFGSLDEKLLVKSMPVHDYSSQDKEIRVINQAVADNCIVRIRYKSASTGNIYEGTCHPYGLVLFGMSLYFIAYLTETNEIRTLKLERLLGVEMTDTPFQRPRDFSLQSYLKGSFGVFSAGKDQTVKVRFTGWAATSIRELQWHTSQKIIEDKQEHVTATFELSDTTEFKRWLLGFGHHAVVLEPRSLVAEIEAELAAMRDSYQSQ